MYRGQIDTPKTNQSVRKEALSAGLVTDIEAWRNYVVDTRPTHDLEVGPIEADLGQPGLDVPSPAIVLRQRGQSHATIMNRLGVGPKLVADQLGHSLDVSLNVYTRGPVAHRKDDVEQLEAALIN